MRKLWGGVFTGTNDSLVDRFGQSIETDLNFWQEDIIASVAHVRMLGEQGIISAEEAQTIERGLEQIHEEGPECLPRDVEDIHTAVETKLAELIGEVAGKLHTGRSRNDQIATDTRLYIHNALLELSDRIKVLQTKTLALAQEHKDDLMPGYTHQQRAVPVTLGFHLLAYFWMLQRTGWRIERTAELANYSPLGAAAIAGTSHPIDRFGPSKELGFTAPIPNALDATSDRGYILDTLHLVASLMIDLSRISNEFVLWSTREFGFLSLGDAVTTGSSIMPQKRNPDMAELIRGRAGQAIGNWVALASTLKGLPLGYNRDTQDDKPPLFRSLRLANDSLELIGVMLDNAQFNTKRMAESTFGDFSTATDIADAITISGVPFRQAHELVGKIVRGCLERNLVLEQLTPELLHEIAPEVSVEVLKIVSANGSVKRRESYGGPGPEAMKVQLAHAEKLLGIVGFPSVA